jgi:2-phosphoglycerate kinase
MNLYEEYLHDMYFDILIECLLLLPYYISDETLESHVYPFFYDVSSEYSQKTLYQILNHYMKKNRGFFFKYYQHCVRVCKDDDVDDADGATKNHREQEQDENEESYQEITTECFESILRYIRDRLFTFPTHWEEIIKDIYLLQP